MITVAECEGTAMAQRICVTGAAGLAGRAVVAELREHGYDVTPTDIAVSLADRENGTLRADLTDYGQAVEALAGADAVVHLANIPAPGLSTPAVTFNSNITMNFNVFHATRCRPAPTPC
jgi:nucleoside-diphosphate-sugar epimerase